jgi:hypothetical protein
MEWKSRRYLWLFLWFYDQILDSDDKIRKELKIMLLKSSQIKPKSYLIGDK